MSTVSITATINGTSRTIAILELPAGSANDGKHTSLSFSRPIKIDSGTAINIVTSFDAAHATPSANASIGFIRHERPNNLNS